MSKRLIVFSMVFLLFTSALAQAALPPDFVYLSDVAPAIQQDMRYAGYHNFIGRPIKGYQAGECILTKEAAVALAQVQKELKKSSLSLKVYDCYRPQMAVDDFIAWSQKPRQQQMKAEFYPRVNKEDFFKLGYVAAKSGHTRGSTVDLTIVPLPTPAEEIYTPGQTLIACFAPYNQRFHDNSIDMGTGFDCMDETAWFAAKVGKTALANRRLLQNIMEKNGFKPYATEWWHFTLKDEPFPGTYFNFPIKPKNK